METSLGQKKEIQRRKTEKEHEDCAAFVNHAQIQHRHPHIKRERENDLDGTHRHACMHAGGCVSVYLAVYKFDVLYFYV